MGNSKISKREEISDEEVTDKNCRDRAVTLITLNNADATIKKQVRFKSLALVAPWLHKAAIVEAVYGGKESVKSLIKSAKDAEASNVPVHLEAASLTNKNAVMYQGPYYTE